jgi:hypothetical protein
MMGRSSNVTTHRTYALSIGLLFLWVTVLLWPLLCGDRPLGGDHSVHYFRAWNLETNLLPLGNVYGWSHLWFAGYPVNYTYPFGADLLVIGIHKASLGILTLSQAYAVTVWLAYFIIVVSVYVFAQSAFDFKIALLAAILMVTDIGKNPSGGFDGTIRFGVWPCALSVGLGLLAVHQLGRVIETAQWRQAGLLGLLVGAALMVHPVQLINVGTTFSTLLFCYFVRDSSIAWKAVLPRMTMGILLGLVIACPFVVPLISSAQLAHNVGTGWMGLLDMLLAIITCHLFPSMFKPASLFGVLGIILLLKDKKPRPLFCALVTPVFLLLGADDVGHHVLSMIQPDLVSHIEFGRIRILITPFWLMCAAYAFWHCATMVWRQFTGEYAQSTTLGRILRIGMLASWMTAAIFIINWPVLNLPLLASERTDNAERDHLVEWLNNEASKDARFYRVALDLDESSYDLSARVKTPLLNVLPTCALLFRYMPHGDNPHMYEATNVRYVLTRRQLSAEDFSLVKEFGPLKVYSFLKWHPQLAEADNEKQQESVRKWSNESIVIESGSEGPGHLIVHTAYFPRWKATLNGIPIETFPQPTNYDLAYLAAPLHKGTYVFSFELSPLEKHAPLIALLGGAGCVMLLCCGRREESAASCPEAKPLAAGFWGRRKSPIHKGG